MRPKDLHCNVMPHQIISCLLAWDSPQVASRQTVYI
jgi:hypothetical protein